MRSSDVRVFLKRKEVLPFRSDAGQRDDVTTLDFHIGLHKTGTSSLQSFFDANNETLKQYSIVYPRTGRKEKKKHKWLAWSVRSVEDLSRLLAELHEECSGFEHAIVSCEEFCSAFLDAAVLEQFCRLARQLFHIRVILYLRRQDLLKESIYAEVARYWYCGSILDENHYEYNHLKRLDVLCTQIPKQDLIVRRHLMRNEVEQDFLAIYGLHVGNGFEVRPPERVSGSRRLAAVLGLLDKRDLQFPAGFIRHLASQEMCKDDGVQYLLSPEQRGAFLRQYEQANRKVAEQYFAEFDGDLFEPPDEDTNWFPVSVPSQDECQRLIGNLWHDYRENAESRR